MAVITLPETNSKFAPENKAIPALKKEMNHLNHSEPNIHFSGVKSCHVSFRNGSYPRKLGPGWKSLSTYNPNKGFIDLSSLQTSWKKQGRFPKPKFTKKRWSPKDSKAVAPSFQADTLKKIGRCLEVITLPETNDFKNPWKMDGWFTWQFCWWPFWDGENVTLSKGCWWPPTGG